MKGSDPEFCEALHLARSFFPESQAFLQPNVGVDWEAFLGAMQLADYAVDHSCDPARPEDTPDLGLAKRGGLNGNGREIYQRLLQHSGLLPRGRAVVIPDAIGASSWSTETCPPFVCDADAVAHRISETPFFGRNRNSLFIYESGAALLVDHDDRVHWSRSRLCCTDA